MLECVHVLVLIVCGVTSFLHPHCPIKVEASVSLAEGGGGESRPPSVRPYYRRALQACVPRGACLSQHPTDTMPSLTPIHIALSCQTSPKKRDNSVPPQQNGHHLNVEEEEKQ